MRICWTAVRGTTNCLIRQRKTVYVAPIAFRGEERYLMAATATPMTAVRGAHYQSSDRPRPKKSYRGKLKRNDKLKERILYIKSVLPKGEMDTDTFQFCLTAIETYAKAEEVCETDLQSAQELLDRLFEETKNSASHQLSATPYIHILRGWARTRSADALEHCRNLFDQMEVRHQENPEQQPNPHQKHVYSALLYACGQTTRVDARAVADTWMKAFEARAKTQNEHLPVELYNQMILAHASRAAEEYGAAAAAEDWLVRLSQLHTEGGPAPTTESFNRVLRAWSLSPESFAVQRGQVILNLMLQLKKDHPDVQPNTDTFATVLWGCGRHGQPEQAEQLWRETVSYFESQEVQVDLSKCLNATTLAWSKHDSPEAADRIDGLLQQCFLQGPTGVSMESVGESMTNLLVALVRRGDIQIADQRLRQFWQSHVNLDTPAPLPGALHYLVRAYKDSDLPDRAVLAKKLLLDAVDLSRTHRSLTMPDTSTFNVCIAICVEGSDAKALAVEVLEVAESVRRVNVFSYTLIINALCKEKTYDSAFEALRLVEKLSRADADHRNPVKVQANNVGLYTAVLGALSSLPNLEAATACFDLFQFIRSSPKWQISTRMYTQVLFSLRVRGKEGRRRAFTIFKEMLQADKDASSRFTLDIFAFQTALRVLHSENDIEAARSSLEVLLTMLHLHDSGRKELTPNQICMDVCFSTISRSGDTMLLSQALQLNREIQRRFDSGLLPMLPSKGVLDSLQK